MEKQKIEFGKYADMHRETTIRGNDDTSVTVRDHIPWEQKEAMAKELAEQTVVIHDESCVFTGSNYERLEKYMVAKYYTDLDVDGVSDGEVADFMVNNGVWEALCACVGDDMRYVREIYFAIVGAVETTYTDDKSLTKAIRTSFPFLFTGEDVSESLAKAEANKDMIYKAIGALRDAEKQREETIDRGRLSVGGNVISISKKKE